MKKILIPLGFFWAAVSCAPASPVHSAEPPSQITGGGEDKERPAQACYAGTQKQRECFSVVQRASLPEGADLYRYPDPYTDPSFPRSFNKRQYLPPDRLLELRAIPASLRLTNHFTRDEVMQASNARGNYGLFSPVALLRLEDIRNEVARPLTVTSGYRSPGHNSQVDGAALWSRHTYGDAVDFAVSGISYQKLAEICLKFGASFYQLYSNHIHCDWRDQALDQAFYPDDGMGPSQLGWQLKTQELGKIVTHLHSLGAEGSALVLSVEMPREDNDDELLYEWDVMASGQRWTGTEPTFSLPNQPGQYQVRVQVGGSLTFERTITIP